MIGLFATSKAGHDQGKIYIIINEDNEYVYLVDGYIRTIDSPKKKRKKHIQLIQQAVDKNLLDQINNKFTIQNEQIKRAIKLYLGGY